MTSSNTAIFGLPASKTLSFAGFIAGSAILALSAQISVDLPFSPVPITGQTFGVLLVAAMLGLRQGTAAVLAYLGQGALGLPVFAGGAAGAQHLFGPTGGYLFGFVLAAAIVGYAVDRGWRKSFSKIVCAMTLATAAIFACGILWLLTVVAVAGDGIGFKHLMDAGVYPYLPGAMFKIAAAATMIFGMRNLIDKKSKNDPA